MARRLSWITRIARAEERGKFTAWDIHYAQDWKSCAVAEKHDFTIGSSLDVSGLELDLGLAFGKAVTEQSIPEACNLYDAIMALPQMRRQRAKV